MIRNACIALATVALLAGPIPQAGAQYRGGPIYGGPFVGGGPSLFVGPYAPPYSSIPLGGSGYIPPYFNGTPYPNGNGGNVTVPVGVPMPYYYPYYAVTNTYQTPKPAKPIDWDSAKGLTPPGGPAEGSRSEPAPAQVPDLPLMSGRAYFTVTVPADAKVMVNDAETKNTGIARRFHTPATLEAGKSYEYTFRAQWMENGQPVTRDRTVQFKAGNDLAIDFTEASAR
jgi:uncharacterized protein (TIGR03000 family)